MEEEMVGVVVAVVLVVIVPLFLVKKLVGAVMLKVLLL